MELDGRDRAVVQLVARFKQLSSQHIFFVLFSSNTSRTSFDRSLRRLIANGYLARIEIRMVGGAKGGSGQYVYCLGRRGFFLYFTGRFQIPRAVNYHSLAIADCYVELRRLELGGELTLVGLSTEPDCWATVGGVQLKPDMHVELSRNAGRHKLWLEMDMGTESQKQLRVKLESYWRAYNDADVAQWPVFPKVLWVGVDEERAKELKWLISQLPQEEQGLFAATTRERLPELFG